MIPTKCLQCGKEMLVKPSKLKMGWGKFCGNNCRGAFKIGRPRKGNYPVAKIKQLTCRTCAKEFSCPDWKTRKNAMFCSHICKGRGRGREKSIGKIRKIEDGYEAIFLPMHPFNNNGFVLYHRFLAEQYLRDFNAKSIFLEKIGNNLYLSPKFVVHHIDCVKWNNWLSNFYICTSGEHTRIHGLISSNPNFKIGPNFL